MKSYAKLTPEGTRDLLFEECDARRRVEVALSTLFKSRNYRKVMTPTMEFYDVFHRESAGIAMEHMYKMTDHHGRLLVLRPDNTMPIARMAATRLDRDTYPLRLYYTQSVFFQNPGLRGRGDEIAQSGVELIGAGGKRADLEIITMAADALEACGAPDFRIELGHAAFVNAVLDEMDLEPEDRREICKLTEAKNYAALGDLLDAMGEREGVQVLKRLPRLFGGPEVLAEAAKLCGDRANAALESLKAIYDDLCQIGLKHCISIDLGIVNRSNYYTGIVFRGYMEGSGVMVLSGGRYDNLIGEFGEPAPAIGFGADVSALAEAMYQRGEVRRRASVERLVFAEDGFEVQAICHARDLRGLNISNEVFVGETLEEAKAYARRQGIAAIDVMGAGRVETIEMAGE
ncbi:MAG: ATP phosphoribosyltransferase regulatory subunit [Clostridiales bacterium]|nr:ATP phosphoribosyltransferase regulatory subunit [Clostridiales bacterium]